MRKKLGSLLQIVGLCAVTTGVYLLSPAVAVVVAGLCVLGVGALLEADR